jgi:hypothetical protein
LLDAPFAGTMASMQTAQLSRLVLVGPSRDERDAKIRRYRLARLKVETVRTEPGFAHLKRVYD